MNCTTYLQLKPHCIYRPDIGHPKVQLRLPNSAGISCGCHLLAGYCHLTITCVSVVLLSAGFFLSCCREHAFSFLTGIPLTCRTGRSGTPTSCLSDHTLHVSTSAPSGRKLAHASLVASTSGPPHRTAVMRRRNFEPNDCAFISVSVSDSPWKHKCWMNLGKLHSAAPATSKAFNWCQV